MNFRNSSFHFLNSPESILKNPDKLSHTRVRKVQPPVGLLSYIDITPLVLPPNRVSVENNKKPQYVNLKYFCYSFFKCLVYPEGDRFIHWGLWDRTLHVCSTSTEKVFFHKKNKK